MSCKGKQCAQSWTSKLENPNQNRNTSNDIEFFYASLSCYERSSCKKSDPEELKWYMNENAQMQGQECDTNCHTTCSCVQNSDGI